MFAELCRTLKNRKGFTLVELMVVVAIIGILVAIAIPVYNSTQGAAETNACKANLRTLDGAIQQYYATTGDWPDNLDDLDPDYVVEVPHCPAGGTYTYQEDTHRVTCNKEGHSY